MKTIYFRNGNLETARKIARNNRCLILNSRVWGEYCYCDLLYYDTYDLDSFDYDFLELTGDVIMYQENRLFPLMKVFQP